MSNETRLIIRLEVNPRDVEDWDQGKFEVIERTTRRYVADAATKRKFSSLPGDKFGAPEDTVIGSTLIEAPADNSLSHGSTHLPR